MIQHLNQLLAIYAEVEAIKVRVEGMKAENISRERQGYALAYGENAFKVEEEKLMALSDIARSIQD